MNKKLILFSVLLIASITWLAAQTSQTPAGQAATPQQTAVIDGAVTRGTSGQPLKGARVTLRPGAQNRLAGLQAGENRRGALQIALGELGGVTVMTDGDGKFRMTGVNPGQYRLSAERDGFIRMEYGQRTPSGEGIAISIAANQRLTIDLPMIQASVMSGRVTTVDGEAASNHTITAYTYQYANGQRSLEQVATAETNDLGEYRLFWLQPGEYFVSVSNNGTDETAVGTVDAAQSAAGRGNREGIRVVAALTGREALTEVLGGDSPPIYYPSTLDPEAAVPLTVAAASEMRGVDFNLRPMRAATVSGRVTAPFSLAPTNVAPTTAVRAGRGVNSGAIAVQALQFANAPVQINLNRVGSSRTGLGRLIGLRLGLTPVNADGTFEIKGVAPGEYDLVATGRDPSGQEFSARTRVSVASTDVTNVVAALRPGAEVIGRIVLNGAPPAQFRMTNLRVSLVTDDGPFGGAINFAPAVAAGRGGAAGINIAAALGGSQINSEAVAEDGTFTLKGVGALEYRVRVTGLPQGAYIQAGRIGSNDALNAPFSVDDPQASLQLQIAFTPGRVTGSVTDSRGLPVPGAQAVLVPDESRRGRSDVYFSATTNQEGQFTFNNVPPGNYKLFAWEAVPPGAYQYPDFIRRYEDRGQPLSVNPNGTVNAEAKLIPAS